MTVFSPSDDDMPSLIREYNSMDPYLRSEFLDARGMTREAWKSMVAAHERRRRAARERRSSTDVSQTERSSTSGRDANAPFKEVVVDLRLPRTAKRVEVLLDAGEGDGIAGSRRYSSAPPSRGSAPTGPGRRRSGGGGRRLGLRGRPDTLLIRIVIMLPEK